MAAGHGDQSCSSGSTAGLISGVDWSIWVRSDFGICLAVGVFEVRAAGLAPGLSTAGAGYEPGQPAAGDD